MKLTAVVLLLASVAVAAASPAPDAGFELVVALKQRGQAELELLFWQVAQPGSPEYLQFRSPEQIAAITGATDQEIATVSAWLSGAGALDVRVASLRDTVTARFAAKPLLATTVKGLPHRDTHPACVEYVLRRDARVHTPPTEAESARPRTRDTLGDAAPAVNYTINNIKKAYGIPLDLTATNDATTQMVWGPGTFGYSPATLAAFKQSEAPLINLDKVVFDTENHGKNGGDNFGEGQLDVKMSSSFGLNATTLVSNTNTSASTEETTGFGAALLDFLTALPNRDTLPQVLSMSLGSLSSASCELLCTEAATMGHTLKECQAYIAKQRQVCMYLTTEQTARINVALMTLGLRGVTVLASSGDGGSHFSFGKFQGGAIANTLNTISCKFQIPVYPTASPYVLSIGGTQWQGSSAKPVTWAGFGGGSGGGFSLQFPAPPHQAQAVKGYLANTQGLPPSSSYNASQRAYPDMSAVGVDGTSQSCPITAGIFSLLVDARLNAGLPPLGFVAPRLYQVALAHPGEAFEDVTQGNSKTTCNNGFPATVGWDPNTGFGRPVWAGMLKYFGDDSHLGL